MQTALLSARKRTATGEYRAALKVAGRSVLAWQAEVAKQLDCERFICLCDRTTDDILELQRSIEADGGEFHAIRTSLQLVALLRGDDTLLVIADGLLLEPDFVTETAKVGGKLRRAVFSLAADHDLADQFPDDFERIDASRSWAGILVMRAAPAQKLADFPPDGDPVSLLLRLALQARTETTQLPLGDGEEVKLLLASSAAITDKHEQTLVARASPGLSLASPGQAIATSIVRLVAPVGFSNGAVASSGVAVALGLAGALLVFQGYPVAGLAGVTLGAFAGSLSRAWSELSGTLLRKRRSENFTHYLSWLIDALAIAVLIFALPDPSIPTAATAIFAMGLARLAARNAPAVIAPFWNDRTVHLATFTICTVYGVLSEALAVFGLIALAQVMLHQARMPAGKHE